MTVKPQRADVDVYRLVDEEEIVGFAFKMANGSWGMFSADSDTRIGTATYASPKEVAKAFEARGDYKPKDVAQD